MANYIISSQILEFPREGGEQDFKGWFPYSRLGSFWVVSGRPKSFRTTEATETTRYDRRFPYGRLGLLSGRLERGCKNRSWGRQHDFSGKLVQNGGCSRPHGHSAGIFTSACHSLSQKDTATKGKA